jgi:hypothetical protein
MKKTMLLVAPAGALGFRKRPVALLSSLELDAIRDIGSLMMVLVK